MDPQSQKTSFYVFKSFLDKKALEEVNNIFTSYDVRNGTKEKLPLFLETVEKNSVPSELKIPMASEKMTLDMVLCVVYPRIAFALQNMNPKTNKLWLPVYAEYITQMIETDITKAEENNVEIFKLDVAILLNASRALIDNEKAIENSISLMKQPNLHILSIKEKLLFDQAQKLFTMVVESPLAKYAIRSTFENLYCKKMQDHQLDEIITSFKDYFCKAIFVENSNFGGLVGIGNIYLDSEIFELPLKEKPLEKCVIAKFIGLGFHEGIHLEQRTLAENFAFLTPKSKNPDDLEGSYLLERYLWGSYDIMYWDEKIADKTINIDNYTEIGGLFKKDEIKELPKRNIINPNCSGLCCELRGKEEV